MHLSELAGSLIQLRRDEVRARLRDADRDWRRSLIALETTIVLVTGEFGRTPEINVYAGRDHWPNCFSLAIAGGGIQSGRVWGASDGTVWRLDLHVLNRLLSGHNVVLANLPTPARSRVTGRQMHHEPNSSATG